MFSIQMQHSYNSRPITLTFLDNGGVLKGSALAPALILLRINDLLSIVTDQIY